MAGNYLKSLQLAKQLEERAREATKNKERAEKEHDELQGFLKLCKENDADVSDAERILADFNASAAAKDYDSALGHVRKATEEAKSAFLKRIGDVADSAEALLTLAQIPPAEAKGAMELLEKSKEQVLRDELEGAMKSAKSAYGASERALHEHFSALFSQAQEVLIQAKEMGDDVGIFEDLLNKGRTALDKQEYETGLMHVREALEGAAENVRVQVNSTIDTAEELMAACDEVGAEVSRVKGHIEKAKANLEALRFKEALAYAKRAESEGENAISSKLQDITREVREGIKKLKSVEEDVSVPQDLLDQAVGAMKEKRYIEAIHATNLVSERVRDMQFKSVLDVIAQAKDKFVLAKKVGVDMTKPIMLLNTARDNLRLGKFEDAVKYAEQSREEIEEALGVFYESRDLLVELAKAMKSAEQMGGDTSEVRNTLIEVKKAFEAKEHSKASERAKEGLAEARKAAYDMTMDVVDSADKAVKLAMESGADMGEAEGLLQRAVASLSKEDTPESMKLAKEALEAADSAMTRLLSEKLGNLDQFVKGFAGEEDLTEASENISEARLRLSDKEFEKAFELLKQIQQRIERAGEEECDRLLAMANAKVEALRSMGGEADDLEILITRVRGATARRVYEDASARAKEVVENAEHMMVKLIQAGFSGIKDTMDEARTVGIDVEPAKGVVKDARTKFEAKDYEGAHSVLRDVRSSLRDKIARYDGIKDKIRRAEELIHEARSNKADVEAAARSLETAKTRFRDGAFDDAEKLLDELTDDAEKKLAMYLAAKLILTSKESVDLGEEHGIDVSEGKELLAKAKELMKSKEYEGALATAKECSEKVSGIISTATEAEVKELHRLLTDAKNIGIDTSGPEALAEKATHLARSGDYPEALRCIDSAKDDIDQIKNLSSQAAVGIKVGRSALRDAESLDMDVGKARELLEQAVEALTRHQYAIALELAKKSSEVSTEVTRNTIRGTLARFKDRIDAAVSEGASVGAAERCLADGTAAFDEGRYPDALRQAMQCEAEIDRAELQREVSGNAVEMARRNLEEADREGIASDEVRRLVHEAEDLLSKSKYVDALGKALESGDELHRTRESLDTVRIEMSSVREQVDRLRKVNIDTSKLDEIVSLAQELLAKQEFAKAKVALRKCSEKAISVFEESINEVMEQNGQLMARAKSMGLDTKACENLMEVAKTSFSEKLWDFAYQQAQACRGMCTEVMSKKIEKLVSDATDRMEPLRRMGASVAQIEDLIRQAQEDAGSGDAAEAFQLLMEADQRILGLEDAHKKYTDISISAESAIQVMKRIGTSTAEAERLLALADLEREKDYDSAIEFVAEALDVAKSVTDSYVPDIKGEVSSAGLQEGSEGEFEIKLTNVGNALAKDCTLELSGQFKVVDLPNVGGLKAGSEVTVKARVVPDVSGDIPVRVNVDCKRQFDGAPLTFQLDGSLKVFKSGPGFKVTRASEMAKCVNCQGRIKQGFDIVSCRCGSLLHLACAKRTAHCPVCQQKYEF